MAMTNGDPARARSLPAGAVFHRCALQVNPHHYAGTFRGQAATGDIATHARDIVGKALELGISVLAVTDHNDVSGVPAFRAAAAGRTLHVFPGFELSSSEGVHVLCLYPPDSEQDQLERYLGAFDITNPKPSSDLSSMGLEDIFAKVREQGGVTVAAHVTSDQGGMLMVLKGRARVTVDKMRSGYRASRNELIKEVLRDYRYIEATGLGVPRKIIAGMWAHNGTEPDLVEEESRFIVRLWKHHRDAAATDRLAGET